MKILRLILAVALSLGFTLPTAAAEEQDESAKLALIIDSSESMQEPDGSGTRLDTAKDVTTDVLAELPNSVEATLLAYGSQVKASATNREEGCRDIRTLSPGDVGSLKAQGYTPIGNALLAAADELDQDGKRAIVLISDGQDTCAPPDVCDVAKDLAKDNIGLAVNIVGFKVDNAARQELNCITQATGGAYLDASDKDELHAALKELTTRAVRGAQAEGTPFTLHEDPAQAQYLGEGQYVTQAAITHNTPTNEIPKQYFRLGIPDGYVAYVSAAVIPDNGARNGQRSDQIGLILDTENPSADECGYHTLGISDRTGKADGYADRPLDTATTSIGPRDDDCDMDEWLVYFQVHNSDTDPVLEEATIETQVSFEPVPSEAELQAYPAGDAGDTSGDSASLAISDPKPITGAPDFNSAIEVAPGSYSDTIVPGEYKYFRFPVEWGQVPEVTIETDPSVREVNDYISAQLYSPLRTAVGDSANLVFFNKSASTGTKTSRMVNFRNREANTGGWNYAHAGDFYLGISYRTGRDDEQKGLDQPIRFAISIDGTPGPGPDWRPIHDPGPEPSDSPIYPESAEATTTTDAPEPTTAAPASTTTAADASPTSNDQTSSNPLTSIFGYLIVLLIALSVPLYLWWSKRNRKD